MDPHFVLHYFILRELQRDGRRRAYRRRDEWPRPPMLLILVLLLGYRCYYALRWVYPLSCNQGDSLRKYITM